MWIQVREKVYMPTHAGIVRISMQTFVNNTDNTGAEFFKLLSTDLTPDVIETTIRSILLLLIPDSEHWVMMACGFNMEWSTIDVVVEHPSLPGVSPGGRIPVIYPKHEEQQA